MKIKKVLNLPAEYDTDCTQNWPSNPPTFTFWRPYERTVSTSSKKRNILKFSVKLNLLAGLPQYKKARESKGQKNWSNLFSQIFALVFRTRNFFFFCCSSFYNFPPTCHHFLFYFFFSFFICEWVVLGHRSQSFSLFFGFTAATADCCPGPGCPPELRSIVKFEQQV